MTDAAYRGTCAWCFGSFAATTTGITTAHGWKEASLTSGGFAKGGRRVGEYGNVFHAGDCRGMTYPPYELSAEGTKARLKVELLCLAGTVKLLDDLAKRPPLVADGKVHGPYDRRTFRSESYEYGVRLLDGETVEVTPDPAEPYNCHTFSYASVHYKVVAEAKSEKAYYENMVALCEDKIAKWKLAPLAPYEPKKDTVHLKARRGNGSYCGNRKSFYLALTDDHAAVTCARCRKAMDADVAHLAAIAKVDADAEKVHAWLLEHRKPATGKEIKAALGLDQKELNKAIERLHGYGYRDSPASRISTGLSNSPTRYTAIPDPKGDAAP